MPEQKIIDLSDRTDAPAPRELTGRQRNTIVIARAIANDLDANGTRDEQHTAALLRLVVDAIEQGYVAELVRHTRKWAAAYEREG
jgi:ABC-type lipoprotein export system ATPase subunit